MKENNEEENKVVSFPAGELSGMNVRALNGSEHKRIDGYKQRLWAKVDEFMSSGAYTNQADFDFKMSTWVHHLVMENQSDRELVLQAGNETQRRFLMVMEAAAKEEEV